MKPTTAEAPPGPLEVLELPAPAHVVARRQLDGVGEAGLRLGHEAALIATADVGADAGLTPVLAARDDGLRPRPGCRPAAPGARGRRRAWERGAGRSRRDRRGPRERTG